MQTLRTRPGVRRGAVLYLRPDDITPNPVQPRRNFDEEALAELRQQLQSGTAMLVKASHAMRFDVLVEQLLETYR